MCVRCRDLRVVDAAEKIPPADLDANWWSTTCAIIAGKFKPIADAPVDAADESAATSGGDSSASVTAEDKKSE